MRVSRAFDINKVSGRLNYDCVITEVSIIFPIADLFALKYRNIHHVDKWIISFLFQCLFRL